MSNSDSLLIQPLQRGPRYELLIRDVLKRDDELSADAPNKLIPAARAQLEVLLDTTKTYLVEANKREATPGSTVSSSTSKSDDESDNKNAFKYK